MIIHPDGLALIKRFEGLRLKAYLDCIGIPTIGYGHVAGVSLGMEITEEQAEKFLLADVAKTVIFVRNLRLPMPEQGVAALTSFAFNLGRGSLASSTLLRKCKRGDYWGASDEFGRWVYAGGVKRNGLVRRREAERKLFLAGWAEELSEVA